jgi:hypothetical protein
MLRTFGAFLSLFSGLSMVVHLDELIYLFGIGALALLVADVAARNYGSLRHRSRARTRRASANLQGRNPA